MDCNVSVPTALQMNFGREGDNGRSGPHKGGDMSYAPEILERQKQHYQQIRRVGGLDVVNDVYARNPKLPSSFWFVGKMARVSPVSLEGAVVRQWNLIEEHAARIRPVELGRDFGLLELWCAPGDTERQMEEHDPFVKLVQVSRNDNKGSTSESAQPPVKVLEVGFNAEVVTSHGVGFRVERTAEDLASWS
jgi:hypothetical protein